MPTKYILNPDGTVTDSDASARNDENNSERNLDNLRDVAIDSDPFYAIIGNPIDPNKINPQNVSILQTGATSAAKNLFYPYSTDVTEVLFADSFVEYGGIDEKITNLVPSNPSFDFVRDESNRETIHSFKQMYSWQDATNDNQFDNLINSGQILTENGVFATEFEMLTGFRFKPNEIPANLLNNTTVGAILYILGALVRFAVLEAILSLNKGSKKNSSRQTFASSSLKLGTYTLHEYDIISKYLIERLNYPYTQQDTISFDKNIVSFLIGFNEFISPDSFLDYRQLGFNRNRGFRDDKGYPKEDVFGLTFIQPIFDTFIESALSSVTNTTSLKRYQLLIKKFFQEKYWIKNQLYKAKNKDEFSLFFAEFSNYHFKFLIERVNVGIKIFERYYEDKTYDYLREDIDHPLHRTSSNRVRANKNSRKKKLKESLSLLPAQSILSTNFLIANTLSGKNKTNILSDISENKKIETNHQINITNNRRLSPESVKELEDKLECEYMPFYFHDVRTNEVLPFHAFLESISDSFQPEYNASSGYGRIDEVRSYVKTTRNISFNFIIAAMCEEDHDLMWYNINKLVMMVYPQWSGAFIAYDNEAKPKDFKYPFTQVPTASPLIRVRIGDVIKSNYSRSSLARLHGVGNRYKKEDNKLIKRNIINDSYKPKKIELKKNAIVMVSAGVYKIAPRETFDFDNKMIYQNLKTETLGKIKEIKDDYVIVDVYNYDGKGDILDELFSDIASDEGIFNIIVDKNKISLRKNHSADTTPTEGSFQGGEDIDAFMKPTDGTGFGIEAQPTTDFKIINPITKAYESGMSRGLAGFITNLTIDYNDMKWETTKIGSKAPMMVKVQVSFAPIHDIPPGLDENGMMRAPVYNAGKTMNNMFGDPHDTDVLGNGLDKVRAKIDEYLKS